ncbi:transposable element Tcb1 transposase [Trichonephila clavipes]|nr:transposable element Tcb1 transposase [Trichonephila clavipes]
MERKRYGDSGVGVWGGIMLDGQNKLHVFDRGSVTGDRYCSEATLTHVRLFRGAIGPDLVFMDDKARHTRLLVLSSYCKVKISLEGIGQCSLLT